LFIVTRHFNEGKIKEKKRREEKRRRGKRRANKKDRGADVQTGVPKVPKNLSTI
jgi:hypothetical protein